ncbi:MAG TPA: hypothetical protein VGX91_15290 [Candidatus Cybelea sp.]|jgi:hypothetical protein|nr:hypothetical protein [Candidatus Cybelea sp.]
MNAMNKTKRLLSTSLAMAVWSRLLTPVDAHEISMPAPLPQPASPVLLKSCYLGTDFMFGDPKLAPEQTKMQLSADLSKPVPDKYRMLGLRFEFGLDANKRSSDVIVFTGSQASGNRDIMAAPPGLSPSGYLPRVSDYDDYHCGIDFAASLDWKSTWYDESSDVVACTANKPVPDAPAVWLTALELQSGGSEAVFLMNDDKQKEVFWSLDGSSPQPAKADDFGRAIVSLGRLNQVRHELTFGASAANLSQQVCFRPFLATR